MQEVILCIRNTALNIITNCQFYSGIHGVRPTNAQGSYKNAPCISAGWWRWLLNHGFVFLPTTSRPFVTPCQFGLKFFFSFIFVWFLCKFALSFSLLTEVMVAQIWSTLFKRSSEHFHAQNSGLWVTCGNILFPPLYVKQLYLLWSNQKLSTLGCPGCIGIRIIHWLKSQQLHPENCLFGFFISPDKAPVYDFQFRWKGDIYRKDTLKGHPFGLNGWNSKGWNCRSINCSEGIPPIW